MKLIDTFPISSQQVLFHTILLGTIACISHFAYQLSGKNVIIGVFNPVNESVWEHLKFMFFPFLFWWIAMYLLHAETWKGIVPLNTLIVSAASSLVIAPLLVVLFYYSYTGVFGLESLLIDILLVFVCYCIALSAASHFLTYSEPGRWAAILSVIVISGISIAFVVFTFDPPKLPIFYDSSSNV